MRRERDDISYYYIYLVTITVRLPRLSGSNLRLACAFGMAVLGGGNAGGVTRTDRNKEYGGGAFEVLIGVAVQGVIVRGSRGDWPVGGSGADAIG